MASSVVCRSVDKIKIICTLDLYFTDEKHEWFCYSLNTVSLWNQMHGFWLYDSPAQKNPKYPSSLHLYSRGCLCRRKDSPFSRNENVTKVLPTCSYFYFFISIKKSWILLYKRTTCFKYLMRRSSHICTQIKKKWNIT